MSYEVFLKIMTERAEGLGAQALSDLMHLSIILQPADHYCGH